MNKESNEFASEIVWQSTETTPDGKPFMSVKKARGYYYYAERGGRDSIAFILYDEETGSLGLIKESKPPMDEEFNQKHMKVTAFGGSIDMDKTPEEICQIEVLEEAGYNIPMENIVYIGKTMVSTQMNQSCFGYMVNVTGFTPGKTEADIHNEAQIAKDADEFSHNEVVWVTENEIMDNNDWKSIWIYSKMYFASVRHIIEKEKATKKAEDPNYHPKKEV